MHRIGEPNEIAKVTLFLPPTQLYYWNNNLCGWRTDTGKSTYSLIINSLFARHFDVMAVYFN